MKFVLKITIQITVEIVCTAIVFMKTVKRKTTHFNFLRVTEMLDLKMNINKSRKEKPKILMYK